MALTDTQIERYSRQIVLPEVGGRGQVRLLQTVVAFVGDGEVAELALYYLAAAGIGRIDWYAGTRIQAAQTLRAELADLNPDAAIHLHPGPAMRVAGSRPEESHTVVAASSRRQCLEDANAAALRARVPLIVGMHSATGGRLGMFTGYDAAYPCLSCALHDAHEVLAPQSVLAAPTAAVIGSLLALEVLALRLGLETTPAGVWLQYDADALTITRQTTSKRPDCVVCAAAAGACT